VVRPPNYHRGSGVLKLAMTSWVVCGSATSRCRA
jgi:hypothetical protein